MCVVTTTHILPNISRTKGNQIMKFGQSKENNVRNTFLSKIIQNIGQGY